MDHPRGVRARGGHIQIRYAVDGRKFEETLDIAPTRAGLIEAARIRKERIRLRKFGEAGTLEQHTFKDLAQVYLDSAKGIVKSTRNSYRDSLNIYWAALGNRDVASLSLADLIQIDESTDWPSEKTRENALIPLRQVLRYAVAKGYCRENPARAMTARTAPSSGPDPYTAEEREKLLAWLDGTLAGSFYRLAFGTGARTGELLAVRWEDLDGDRLHINRARVRGELKSTKTGKARSVLLLPDTAAMLRAMPRPIRGGEIITNQYGRPYQSGYHLNRWFRKAHTATGVRERGGPYPWRSTYASLALSSGVRPSLIAQQLGHRVDVLLSVYAKYVPRDDDASELAKMGSGQPVVKQEGAG